MYDAGKATLKTRSGAVILCSVPEDNGRKLTSLTGSVQGSVSLHVYQINNGYMKIYQADAFTDKVFSGNPAAVCPLSEWLPAERMQQIAMENNLSETAFVVKNKGYYEIRWFTPSVEVDLCGHATLAAAFVLFNYEGCHGNTIRFVSHISGELGVSREGEWLTLNFPADDLKHIALSAEITAGLNIKPREAYEGRSDILFVFDDEDQILGLLPDYSLLSKLDARGIIVTAPGSKSDFVSRFFGPKVGINEDPVTGSAHTTLTPYWSQRLNKEVLTAIQLSSRKGYLRCRAAGRRVEISGKCRLFMQGQYIID
jgi:PhzF family phenazine biosynthesis protein